MNLTGLGLTKLDISHCFNITGNLDALRVSETDRMPLQGLNLYGAKIQGNLASLEGMDLMKLNLGLTTQVTGDLESLKTMQYLEVVNLRCCNRITGDLKNLKGMLLRTLDLRSTENIKGELRFLIPMVQLEVLNLSECQGIQGDLSCFKTHRASTVIELGGCCQVQGALSELSPLYNLTKLNIEGQLLNYKNK